ncbi:hypothetical protein B0H65DRAFT_545507 [Neurospora tetraspora]|uniref:Uncharacterized protein n=1 Tax=Neurospora tetraspora TaxID=94610 RepID=A0AAE0JJ59_9PEZI|nr:hypothetical protein B0H65DRAFT_545507 [Neurospora tetraspora]
MPKRKQREVVNQKMALATRRRARGLNGLSNCQANSPLRRRQPSQAVKDIGLARQSLSAATEAPACPCASSQPLQAPTHHHIEIPIPITLAQGLLQIQHELQQQIQQIQQAVHKKKSDKKTTAARVPITSRIRHQDSWYAQEYDPCPEPYVS